MSGLCFMLYQHVKIKTKHYDSVPFTHYGMSALILRLDVFSKRHTIVLVDKIKCIVV